MGPGRKKRKLEDERSPRSHDPDNRSIQNDDIEKSVNENMDASSTKSETTSSHVEKSPSNKKSDPPVKVQSQYFNSKFDLSGKSTLLAFLF